LIYIELETPAHHLHRIVVEVKDWSRPVGIDVVNKFVVILNLLRQERLAHEGVIVSTKGFSKPARNAAKMHDIRLLEMSDLEAMLVERKGQWQSTPTDVSSPSVGLNTRLDLGSRRNAISAKLLDFELGGITVEQKAKMSDELARLLKDATAERNATVAMEFEEMQARLGALMPNELTVQKVHPARLRELTDQDLDDSQRRPGFQALSQAGTAAEEAAIRAEAAQRERKAKQRARRALAEGAIRTLHHAIETLFGGVIDTAPTAKRSGSWTRRLRLELGAASLEVKLLNSGRAISKEAFPESGWDVIVGATVCVSQVEPTSYKWGANLWYTNLGQGSEYRWWEIPYFTIGRQLSQHYANYEPFALDVAVDSFVDADLAASPVMHTICIAAEPVSIDDENLDAFCDRWAHLLAKAYQGKLRRPSSFPFSR
jgi:hypothetical protein